jgi:gliding motility-associated-like protein
MQKNIFLLLCLAFLPYLAKAQIFQNQGAAVQTDAQCYRLTTATRDASGTIWSRTTIDLSQSFDFTVAMNLGCTDVAGADGIAFGFHQQGPALVPPSGGTFLSGISPSFVVEIDTYENTDYGDPAFDHIMISKNGEVDSRNGSNILAASVQASATSANIEDCSPHLVRMVWDAAAQRFEVYFDCVLRASYTGDIVTNIFGGNPNVTWGYKGSTGGYFNEQSVCIIEASFLNTPPKEVCRSSNLDITAPPARSTFWTSSGGTITQNTSNPRQAVFNAATPGNYTVTATQVDYCSQTATFTYNVIVNPCCDAAANIITTQTTCAASCDAVATAAITAVTGTATESYAWSTGATTPAVTGLCAATYTVTVSDANYCTKSYTVAIAAQATPVLNIGPDATYCDGTTVTLDAGILNAAYAWDNGAVSQTFATAGAGTYTVTVTIPGCPDPLTDQITLTFIPSPIVELGADQTLCYGASAALDAGNPGFSYLWQNGFTEQILTTSATGRNEYKVKVYKDKCFVRDSLFVEILPQVVPLSQNSLIFCKENDKTLSLSAKTGYTSYLWNNGQTTQIAVLMPPTAGVYTVTASNSNNCTGTATITLLDECEPEMHVPTAFTPNNDGMNDVLELFGTNIKTFEMSIFNRWGQVVFASKSDSGLTNCTDCFWNGKYNGTDALGGIYTYRIKYTGETNAGVKIKNLNGNVLLIRKE